jgi:hypothetical protein
MSVPTTSRFIYTYIYMFTLMLSCNLLGLPSKNYLRALPTNFLYTFRVSPILAQWSARHAFLHFTVMQVVCHSTCTDEEIRLV